MDVLIPALAVAVIYSFLSLRVLRQYERGVAFFLGRFWGTKGPGLIFLPAGFAGQKRVSLRIVALDIPPQDVITRDNVSVKVNAVLYMRVIDPAKAVIEIEDYLYATSQLAQTTLRSVLGEVELDELLSDREKINAVLKKIIDERTDAWGIEVSAVEVKDVDLPDQMKRAMARQAEAERERRAKVIAAQGELQASETLAQAAHTLAQEPSAIQLRYLQTVTEIAAENNSTTIFPIPIELFRPFLNAAAGELGRAGRTRSAGLRYLFAHVPAPNPGGPDSRARVKWAKAYPHELTAPPWSESSGVRPSCRRPSVRWERRSAPTS
jgi:regulator of protease activity HflC (stomatin/prohibitin superfamily)